jgi:hypothetical protein
MHMPLRKIEKRFGRLRLLAILVFLPLSAPLCHAQCYEGSSSGVPIPTTLSPSYYAPGQTYNANLTVPSGGFTTACGSTVFYIVNAASYDQGLYYDEDPYVTVSNLAYVSPTEITFTVTVASNAPTESDAWADITLGSWLVSGLGAVQITPCAHAVTPTISSIQPTAFFAGQSTIFTITGTGFMPTNNANSCAPTTVSITSETENVALSNVNVSSPTQITVTAAPQASDPLEAASVTVSNYNLNGPPYYLTSNSEAAEILPVPAIQLNNNTISGTNAPAQSAVVGQPINLTTIPTAATLQALQYPIAISQTTWTVMGTNIGGYTPTQDSTTVLPTTLSNPSLSTYWVYGASGLHVTYTYCVNVSGPNPSCSLPATATYKVTGPGTASMKTTDYGTKNNAATIDSLYVPPSCNSSSTAPFMVYGELSGPGPGCSGAATGTPGISFTASGASSEGKYVFVQTISTDSSTLTTASGSSTCSTTPSPGLDTSFPYPATVGTNGAEDAPEMALPEIDTSASRTFVATMYLMWTSTSVANAIPVPLGYQQWQFQAKTTNPGAPTELSWTTPTVEAHGPIGNFAPAMPTMPNNGYPVWSGLAACTYQ